MIGSEQGLLDRLILRWKDYAAWVFQIADAGVFLLIKPLGVGRVAFGAVAGAANEEEVSSVKPRPIGKGSRRLDMIDLDVAFVDKFVTASRTSSFGGHERPKHGDERPIVQLFPDKLQALAAFNPRELRALFNDRARPISILLVVALLLFAGFASGGERYSTNSFAFVVLARALMPCPIPGMVLPLSADGALAFARPVIQVGGPPSQAYTAKTARGQIILNENIKLLDSAVYSCLVPSSTVYVRGRPA